MLPISITFSTPTNPNLKWFDSFKDLTDQELDEIAVHCRSATAAIFTELSDRRSPWEDKTLENYHHMLLENANQINKNGLTHEHEVYLDNIQVYLAGPGDTRNEVKVVRQFLWLVSRIMDWSYALLLLCSLGKYRLQKLDEDRRVKLVKYITQDRDVFSCPILKDRAIQCQLHQIHIKIDPPLTRGSKKRKRKDSQETATDGTGPASASRGNDTVFHSISENITQTDPTAPDARLVTRHCHQNTFANFIQAKCAPVKNHPSPRKRSVSDPAKELQQDFAPPELSHPSKTSANLQSSLPSKAQQMPHSLASLTSQQHESAGSVTIENAESQIAPQELSSPQTQHRFDSVDNAEPKVSSIVIHMNCKAFEQSVSSAQDPNRSYNNQPQTTALQLQQRHQQSQELVPYSTQHATIEASALKAPHFGGSTSNVNSQPLHDVFNPGAQHHTPSQVSTSSIINQISERSERGEDRLANDNPTATSCSPTLTRGRQEALCCAVKHIQMPTDMHVTDCLLRCMNDFASLMLNKRQKRTPSLILRREQTASQQPREGIPRVQLRRCINATTDIYESVCYYLKLGEPLKAIERLKDARLTVPYIFVDPDLFLLTRLIQIATWSSWKKFPEYEPVVFRFLAACARDWLSPEHPLTLLLGCFSKAAAISMSYPTLWTCVINHIDQMADEQYLKGEAQEIRIKAEFYLIGALARNGNSFAATQRSQELIQLCVAIDGVHSFTANRARYSLAKTLCNAGNLEAAIEAYDEARKYLGTADCPYKGWIFAVFATNELAQLYEQEGNIHKAGKYYEEALVGFLQRGGDESSGALLMLKDLIGFHERYGHEEQLARVKIQYPASYALLSAGRLDEVRLWVGPRVTTAAGRGKKYRAWFWMSPI